MNTRIAALDAAVVELGAKVDLVLSRLGELTPEDAAGLDTAITELASIGTRIDAALSPTGATGPTGPTGP